MEKRTIEEELRSMTEIGLQMRNDSYYEEIKENLRTVLDFVERHNKQDEEEHVARAAQYIARYVIK